MGVQDRVRMCRIIDQMENRPALSKRLGLENKSILRGCYVNEKFEKKRGK